VRAVQVTGPDGPGALEVAEVGEPVRGDDEVLIEVHAVGINFPDVLLTRGAYQYKPEMPFVLGGELGGVVLEAPSGSSFSPGDRVAATSTTGALAERVTAKDELTFPLPDAVDLDAAACLPMNYLTMSFGLVTRGGLQAGETVLVHGAAGGIGTATIQLAAALGARVIAVASSPEKQDVARRAGAHDTVPADGFKDAVAELTGGQGVDVVVDPVGGDRFTDSLRSLAPLGRLLVVGFTAGEIPTVKVNRLLLNNLDVRGVGWGAYALPRPGYAREEWDWLWPLLESGALAPPISARRPLEEAGAAVALLEDRQVLGRVVVRCAPRS
jgi:NADPH2:quinone reductase